MIPNATLRSEVLRTSRGFVTWTDAGDDQHVQLTDGGATWWQPADELATTLAALPDGPEHENEEQIGQHVSAWRDAAKAAGVFNSSDGQNTMDPPGQDRQAEPTAGSPAKGNEP